MDSVMDFVNISAINHAIQERQSSHYQTIKDLKRGSVRDVRDKKRKKLIRAYTEMVCQRIMLSWPLIIDINVKTLKTTRISEKSISLS
jgi:hypothetical protein